MPNRTVFEGDTFKLNCGSIATIIKYMSSLEVEIITDTGYKTVTNVGNLRKGSVKDKLHKNFYEIGYIGNGSYDSLLKCEITWKSMIKRCYSDKNLLKQPTYINSIVCDDWHNLQNYKKWFYNNYKLGYQLDKDLKKYNSKIYSPDTCTFLPSEVNNFFLTGFIKNSTLPFGVNISNKKFVGTKFCGVRESLIEAVNDYWNWKNKKVIKLIEKYPELKDLILNYFEHYFNDLYPEYIKNKVIVDLEGCLSNAKHRMHLLKENKFLEFQKQFENDTLNENVNIFIQQFKEFRECEIVILTAKREEYKELVVKWLKKYNVIYDKLIMKNEELSDIKFKERYARVHKEEIMFALDDTGKIAQMFSENGVPCLRIEQNE